MINLLPPEQKRQIRAGQSNVLLIRYCFATLLLAIVLTGLIFLTYVTMTNSRHTAEAAIQEGEAKTAEYASTQQAATEFKNNLATAKSILDKEVRYTKVAVKIAQALPAGIVLQSLELNADTFGQPMTLNTSGKTYDDAIRLKTELQASTVFQEAHLVSVSQSADANSAYPVSIVISVTINPGVLNA